MVSRNFNEAKSRAKNLGSNSRNQKWRTGRDSGDTLRRDGRIRLPRRTIHHCAMTESPVPRWRPDVLLLGASGHVAQAFLLRVPKIRSRLGRLILLDQSDAVLGSPFLDHAALRYEFLLDRLGFPEGAAAYTALLQRCDIDIVIDLTDMDTLPILSATDSAGASYINSSLNEAQRSVADVVAAVHPTRERRRCAPHILSSGMNPGVVNIWVWDGARRHGAPSEIVHFELDTSTPADGWRPLITWSRKEFLTETVWERTGLVENGELKILPENSLHYRESLRPYLELVAPMADYPRGMLVLHEENVKLGQKLGASSKYLYAVHPRTMEYLQKLWSERGWVEIGDLELGDNTSVPLSGSDTIGVCLKYPDKQVVYLHSLSNSEVVGTNATCAQVAVGVDAALYTLLTERLASRIYFASDLYHTSYRERVLRGLRVEKFVFDVASRTFGSKLRHGNELQAQHA